MTLAKNHLELLSPARDVDIGKQAILHGADAVYIGGPTFGARHNAGNTIQDIAQLSEFAHTYNAKIFVALNTILHDNELEPARQLIHHLYDAGVDALIVQDMGILQLDIPPIALHASTQTDIRSVAKAQFLSQVGFSQLVLARELTLTEIKDIAQTVDAAIEFFVHGALCVAFSGQCYISHAQTGRSANRGDCSQACRLPYTLKDEQGRVVAFEKHLLSMKDNNQSQNLSALIQAGVRSFKIEGRYKDMGYVKNMTAHYRQLIDQLLEQNSDFIRSSSGVTTHHFIPDPDKTFHRGSTDYFVNGRLQDIAALDSPKFIGREIGQITQLEQDGFICVTQAPLHNGDGLNILFKRDIIGFRANAVQPVGTHQYRVSLSDMPQALKQLRLPHPLNRNLDHLWQQQLTKTSATRKIAIKLTLADHITADQRQYLSLTVHCEDGVMALSHSPTLDLALAEHTERVNTRVQDSLSKLGNTDYIALNPRQDITIDLSQAWFIPSAVLNQLRRDGVIELIKARQLSYCREVRQPAVQPAPIYPEQQLSYLANVYNHQAREFYVRHGVQLIEPAYEAHQERDEVPVMITKHCLRYSFYLCPKQAKGVQGVMGQVRAEPMQLIHNNEIITLKFNCRACEMQVMGKIKPHVLKQRQLGEILA